MDSNELRRVLKAERADQTKRSFLIVGALLVLLVVALVVRALRYDGAVEAERFIQSIQ